MVKSVLSSLVFVGSTLLFTACGGTQAARFSGDAGNASLSADLRVTEEEYGGKNQGAPSGTGYAEGICKAGQMTPDEAAQVMQKTPIVYNQVGGTVNIGYGSAYVKIYGDGNVIDIQVGGGSLVIEIYGGGNSLVGGGGSSIIHLYGDDNTVDLNGGGSNILNFYGVSNTLAFAGGGCNSAYFTKGLLSVNNSGGGGGGNNVNNGLAETKVYTLP